MIELHDIYQDDARVYYRLAEILKEDSMLNPKQVRFTDVHGFDHPITTIVNDRTEGIDPFIEVTVYGDHRGVVRRLTFIARVPHGDMSLAYGPKAWRLPRAEPTAWDRVLDPEV